MGWRILTCLAGLALAVSTPPAHACSTIEGYEPPSNFELVRLAEALVIATAVRPAGDVGLVFRIDSAVKGIPPAEVSIFLAQFGDEHGIGMCNRYSFTSGRQYVLFLDRGDDGRWGELGYPFAPISQDYEGEDSEWVRMIRRYLALQRRLPPLEQLAALRRMVETGRDVEGRALSTAERFDIVDHLSAITPWKPTEWLVDLYDRLERGDPLPFPPRPQAGSEPGHLGRAVAAFLAGRQATATVDPEPVRLQLLRALAVGRHPAALPLFDRLAAAPGLDSGARGLVLRYFASHGHYGRAWHWVETRLMAELPLLGRADALTLLRDVDQVQRGDSFEEGQERWRSLPRAASAWPELALALYWYQVRSFGGDEPIGFFDAIGAIPVRDFRERPELTVALAAANDEAVERWALQELQRPTRPARLRDEHGNPAGITGDEVDMLPLRVLLTVWRPENEALLVRAFCEGGERRRLLIYAIGEWGDYSHESLVLQMANAPDLAPEDRPLVFRAAVQLTARNLVRSTSLDPGEENRWLVTSLVRHPQGAARPMRCPA